MKSELREKAITMRVKQRMSYSAIRKRLGVSKSTLSYWLQEFPLTNAEIVALKKEGWKRGEVSREKYRVTMRTKKAEGYDKLIQQYVKRFSKISREAEYVAGIMLYLAEGDKRNANRIVLANTDPRIITFFVKWLQQWMGVGVKDIRIQLHLYENMRVAKEKKFWQNMVRLPASQFYKAQVRSVSTGKYSYAGRNRHGTCSIFLPGTKRKSEIMAAGDALLGALA